MYSQPQPEQYAIYYEDAAKVRAYQAAHGEDEPADPGDLDSRVDVDSWEQVRPACEKLLAGGHGTPRVFERVDILPDAIGGWDWDEEWRGDFDV